MLSVVVTRVLWISSLLPFIRFSPNTLYISWYIGLKECAFPSVFKMWPLPLQRKQIRCVNFFFVRASPKLFLPPFSSCYWCCWLGLAAAMAMNTQLWMHGEPLFQKACYAAHTLPLLTDMLFPNSYWIPYFFFLFLCTFIHLLCANCNYFTTVPSSYTNYHKDLCETPSWDCFVKLAWSLPS